jgi:hypothetical protein
MQPSPEYYPLNLAAEVLAPEPMTDRELRALLRKHGIRPAGKWKISGAALGEMRARRDLPLYSAMEILAMFNAIDAA